MPPKQSAPIKGKGSAIKLSFVGDDDVDQLIANRKKKKGSGGGQGRGRGHGRGGGQGQGGAGRGGGVEPIPASPAESAADVAVPASRPKFQFSDSEEEVSFNCFGFKL